MQKSQAIKHVLLEGIGAQPLLVRPGLLHSKQDPPNARVPFVYALPKTDPVRSDHPPVDLEVSPQWSLPEFIGLGSQGEVLDSSSQWTYALHLTSLFNASASSFAPLAADVALDLGPANNALRAAAPRGGAIFLCTRSGIVLAGSNWEPRAAVGTPASSQPLPGFWDLPLSWGRSVMPSKLANSKPSEIRHGNDLILVEPLKVGNTLEPQQAREDLRVIVFTPEGSKARVELGNLSLVAVALSAIPPAVCVLVLIMFAIIRLVRCCRH